MSQEAGLIITALSQPPGMQWYRYQHFFRQTVHGEVKGPLVIALVAYAGKLVAAGADLIDIGGESTRPGAVPVAEAAEISRVVPVIAGIRDMGITLPITIDTTKAKVARFAVAAGANAVNDVSAFDADQDMAATVAEIKVPAILMHMSGTPRTMQSHPHYEDVVTEVANYLESRLQAAVAHGIPRTHLAVDPGIGFGKTVRHNLLLLKHLRRCTALGVPVVVGTSRKSFIGTLLSNDDGDRPVTDREWGTAATVALGIANGARVVRIHDVAHMADVARMADAIVGV